MLKGMIVSEVTLCSALRLHTPRASGTHVMSGTPKRPS